MDNDPVTLVTMRLADLTEDHPRTPGSIDGRCYSCDEPVTIGPEAMAQMKLRPGSRVLCTVCLFAELATYDRDQEVKMRAAALPDEEWIVTAGELADDIDEVELNR